MSELQGDIGYLKKDLKSCKLCEWRCGANRLEGELGVCGITIPEVASSQLHPAPPASFDAFMTGCSFRCLSCQNWPVANYPANDHCSIIEGYYDPAEWAELALTALSSPAAALMGADRLFFTGGEPTCSLPWVEAVVGAARSRKDGTKVNFDTNGYMTMDSLKRILEFADSMTFDIKAFDPGLFSALTGADAEFVLRNAEHIAKKAPEKIWEFRILVIPGISDDDLIGLCDFIASIDPGLPVNFLAFRPNFAMVEHPWTPKKYMERCVEAARIIGLENVSWSGRTKGELPIGTAAVNRSAERAVMDYALSNGCVQKEHRNCGRCKNKNKCQLKRYQPGKLN